MLRLLLYIITLVFAATWLAKLADIPGSFTLEWLGWRTEASLMTLLFLVGSLVFTAAVSTHLLYRLVSWPHRWAHARREKKLSKGFSVLTEAFSALWISDLATAKKLTHRADSLLNHPPITKLLMAQLAVQEGRPSEASAQLKPLLAHKETQFLAARGLLEQARKTGNVSEALLYAEQAHTLRPDSSYITLALVDLYMRRQSWQQALDAIARGKKKDALSKGEAARYKALVHFQHANYLYNRGELDTAYNYAHSAYKFLPNMVPATVLLSNILLRQGKQRQAEKIILRAWKHTPHTALIDVLRSMYAEEAPNLWLKRVQKLAASAPAAVESNIATAEAAITANEPTLARKHLDLALQQHETVALCLLMSRMESELQHNEHQASLWRTRAEKATPDAAWHCGQCHAVTQEWSLHCNHCGSFDSLNWASPELSFRDAYANNALV